MSYSSNFGAGMGLLFLILYIAIMVLTIWIGYKITKAAIKNGINDSEVGKYFKNKNERGDWNSQL